VSRTVPRSQHELTAVRRTDFASGRADGRRVTGDGRPFWAALALGTVGPTMKTRPDSDELAPDSDSDSDPAPDSDELTTADAADTPPGEPGVGRADSR